MSLSSNSLLREKYCVPKHRCPGRGDSLGVIPQHSAVPQQCPGGIWGSGVAYLVGSIINSRLQDEQRHLVYQRFGLCFACVCWACLAAGGSRERRLLVLLQRALSRPARGSVRTWARVQFQWPLCWETRCRPASSLQLSYQQDLGEHAALGTALFQVGFT